MKTVIPHRLSALPFEGLTVFRPVLLFYVILRTDSLSCVPDYLILVLNLKLGKFLAFPMKSDGRTLLSPPLVEFCVGIQLPSNIPTCHLKPTYL